MNNIPIWAAYLIPLLIALAFHLHRRKRRESVATATLSESISTGMTEPPSLHPVVDLALCMGSGACAAACPEEALGIINGKMQLINPTLCIGHGACAATCPVEAIKLVFGTEKRGIDIPVVKPSFETNVPGIYIAGELGGMGLVRKAAEQGRQAIASINSVKTKTPDPAVLDVLIVGAGPAGLAATLGAMESKLRFVTLEQEDSLGGTVYHYPRNKIVMTQPVVLPLVGEARLGEISKEALLAFWQDIVNRVAMPISFGERVDRVTKADDCFVVKTDRNEYRANAILLAIGRRGTPRKLGVDGEQLSKVVYRLIDPEQYRGQHVLVVGGGDSAIEAAVALAGEDGTTVTLSYRSEAFGRVKQKNRERLSEAEAGGRLQVMLSSSVSSISETTVNVSTGAAEIMLPNEAIIVCAGGILPMPMLRDMGITVETKYGSE